jgi:hypothetical protein
MALADVVDEIKLRPTVKGLLTLVPGAARILGQRGTGGTNTAAYCYGVWMKHLTLLWANGMRSIPDTVGELGPGDSLGVGLSAMLSGTNHYYALDVVEHSSVAEDLRIFDELVALFVARSPRPTKGWPDFDEYLDNRLFPSHILTEDRLSQSLSPGRLASIRDAIEERGTSSDVSVRYMVPWSDPEILAPGIIDLLLSHSVLEHVVNLEDTYRAMHLWLKPRGIMSHQIDFTCHGISKSWNGYRTFPETLWKIINGRRTFLINREPRSVHIDLIEKGGFSLICELVRHRPNGVDRASVSSRWKNIGDDDLTCSGIFVQAEPSDL